MGYSMTNDFLNKVKWLSLSIYIDLLQPNKFKSCKPHFAARIHRESYWIIIDSCTIRWLCQRPPTTLYGRLDWLGFWVCQAFKIWGWWMMSKYSTPNQNYRPEVENEPPLFDRSSCLKSQFLRLPAICFWGINMTTLYTWKIWNFPTPRQWFFLIFRMSSNDALPKTNIAPENRPPQKEISSSNNPYSGAMLVSGRVYILDYFGALPKHWKTSGWIVQVNKGPFKKWKPTVNQDFWQPPKYMGVSKNSGTPKSSILIGFSITKTIHFGVPLFLETSISWITTQSFNRKNQLTLKERLSWKSSIKASQFWVP